MSDFQLLQERNWLATELRYGEAAIDDMGLGLGQADIYYTRGGQKWHVTLTKLTDDTLEEKKS